MRVCTGLQKGFLKVKRRGAKVWGRLRMRVLDDRGEFGMNAVIGIAIGLIVAAFVLIPGIKVFAGTIISDMQAWWSDTVSSQIFPH